MSKRIDSDFGERLKQAADKAKIPYSQTSMALCLGVSKQHVDSWMKGSLPRADQLWKIAERFGVDARWLATGKPPTMSETVHSDKRMIPSAQKSQKILAVLTALLDTDDEGVAEIVAAAEAVIGEHGSADKQRNRFKRPSR